METIKVVHSRTEWLRQTETWLYTQVIHLDTSVESHIICQCVRNLDQFQVSNIHQLPEPSFLFETFYERALKKLKVHTYSRPFLRELREIQASILHSHFGNEGWYDMPTAKKARVRHIVTFYGYDVGLLPRENPAWKARYQELFQHIDLVLCEGPFMARSITHLGCPDNKVKVHHLGIPVNEIAFKPRVWEKDQPLRVLIAASFREKKGIPYAIEALGKIKDLMPLDITIIGDADEWIESQVEKRRILQCIEKNNLSASTHLLGYQPYNVLLTEAYKHHIFLSPSITASNGDSEGGAPIALLEMAATGMPLVSTKHCDIPEVIHDGETGFLAEERDVQGLVHKLRWLIEHRENWLPFLEKARTHIEKEYDANIQGIRLANIYKEVL